MNCEIELDMRWERNCAVPKISRTFTVVPDSDPVAREVTTQTTSETFKLNTEVSRTFRVGPFSDPVACEVTT